MTSVQARSPTARSRVDIERVRRDEDGFAAFGKIAGELNGLREELRGQMASSMRREFDELRQDFRSAGAQAGRSDERGITMLRLEMEQMKGALDQLAREETVLSVDRRWEDFDRRFNDFEHRVAHGGQPHAAELATLTDRIEQIGRAVGNLPESLSLRALEDKVRTLAGALDQFIAHQDGRATQAFSHIEERLDEISRAIVSATIAAQKHLDLEPFEKIEGAVFPRWPARSGSDGRRLRRRRDGASSRPVAARRRSRPAHRRASARQQLRRPRRCRHPRPRSTARRNLAAHRGSASQFAGIDPDLVRGLEAQVAGLSAHASRPSTPLPEFVDISPRLREIEKSIAENRESVMEAARAAAETTRALAGGQPAQRGRRTCGRGQGARIADAFVGRAQHRPSRLSTIRCSRSSTGWARSSATASGFRAQARGYRAAVDRCRGHLPDRETRGGCGRTAPRRTPPGRFQPERRTRAGARRHGLDARPAVARVQQKDAAETAEPLAGSVAEAQAVEPVAPDVNLDAPLDRGSPTSRWSLAPARPTCMQS